jgi:hypothetical protein
MQGEGRRARHTWKKKAQATENELEAKMLWKQLPGQMGVIKGLLMLCGKKKSLRKAGTRQSIPTRATNKTHSKQCHGVVLSVTAQ